MNWTPWVLFVGFLWLAKGNVLWGNDCLPNEPHYVLKDDFNDVIKLGNHWSPAKGCILLTNGNMEHGTGNGQSGLENGIHVVFSKKHMEKLYILRGRQCKKVVSNITDLDSCADKTTPNCSVSCLKENLCKHFDEKHCGNITNRYIVNVTGKVCLNCNNPVKKVGEISEHSLRDVNRTIYEGEEVKPENAAELMDKMVVIANSINTSSNVIIADGVTGILVKEKEPEETKEVSIGYKSSNGSLYIVESESALSTFERSVMVPKEAFDKAVCSNVTQPFVAIFRFNNMAMGERNIVGNEVIAVEMGARINNLTDKISIQFRNIKQEGEPSCQSWNGQGRRLNWTDAGCETIRNGDNITCQCSHLTFFAILLTLNETTSSFDLKNLTIITQVGCGLSMFFLSIVLFMHFLLRRTKANTSIKILIHLVSAMFLLNFTFLINNVVAKLKSSVGCKIMAVAMHYSMLATFTWFAVQAFHLWLQLYMKGRIVIHRYLLKVSIISWALPSVIGIILLIIGKYGEQVIQTDNNEEDVTMCWITDSQVHYIVNIGYYALVFLFTFTTFIVIIYWLFLLNRTPTDKAQSNTDGQCIITILGLCCILGITWGCAFFAHGVFRIPAYYIFTVLNSFQGFFLFIYYYRISKSREAADDKTSTSSSSNTLKTIIENPYSNKI